MMREELQAIEDIANDDYPHISNALKSHLQGRWSLRNTTSEVARFKAEGFSEAYILGWLQGVNGVMEYIDHISNKPELLEDE
ncbi:hypothetical protein [Providencia phage PSTRCR_120]|uniref:Uncharacterized protein n=1 Tax=Providencia phage PSTRCR_120 TaxID=2800826 RepID=A0A7T6ZLY9_9CAUD|nr:hypothetical protein [Providencia phage PSTRCR_120]